jgi:hypothetical protein
MSEAPVVLWLVVFGHVADVEIEYAVATGSHATFYLLIIVPTIIKLTKFVSIVPCYCTNKFSIAKVVGRLMRL